MIGRLRLTANQFEYRDDARNLTVRGAHPEWVLQAAAEVVALVDKAEAERLVAEAAARFKAGEVHQITVDATEMALKQRFDLTAQCAGTMGRMDYKWTAPGKTPPVSPNGL